jgi:hypothetical protein
MEFKKKNILIISQQSWGKLFVSKHHYALELAKMGNNVFFLNPPNEKFDNSKKRIEIIQSKENSNLHIIYNTLWFPYFLKFHFLKLFHLLMRFQIKKIIKKVGIDIDLVWSFDLANVFPLIYFTNAAIKIFHPVDPSSDEQSIKAAIGADYIFTTAEEISMLYNKSICPKKIINHGLSEVFLNREDNSISNFEHRIGISGNLLRHDIDHNIMISIFKQNPECIFECWGTNSYPISNHKTHESSLELNFIKEISRLPNVIMHGVVSTQKLAEDYQRMNAFLICYDLNAKNKLGPNYHKVLEFMSTGKIIVSNYMSPYSGNKNLIKMAENINDNSELPKLFKEVMANLCFFNSSYLQQTRKRFAEDNLYRLQILRIESFINQHLHK